MKSFATLCLLGTALAVRLSAPDANDVVEAITDAVNEHGADNVAAFVENEVKERKANK